MSKKENEIKLVFVGAKAGLVEKLIPDCALQVGDKLALDIVRTKLAAYTPTKNGKRFDIAVPSGNLFNVLMAANQIAQWCKADAAGALKVILENAQWVENLPNYFNAVAAADVAKADFSSVKKAISYYGKIIMAGELTQLPENAPESLQNKFWEKRDALKGTQEEVAYWRKFLTNIAYGLLRPSIERYFSVEG